jgi:hypothetical protein
MLRRVLTGLCLLAACDGGGSDPGPDAGLPDAAPSDPSAAQLLGESL